MHKHRRLGRTYWRALVRPVDLVSQHARGGAARHRGKDGKCEKKMANEKGARRRASIHFHFHFPFSITTLPTWYGKNKLRISVETHRTVPT